MVCFIVAYLPADSKPGGEKRAQTGEEVKGKRGKTLLWPTRVCALALADEGIRTFRAGEEEESPSGDSGCPARAAHKRTGRGPLVNHPGQRRGRSASPSFGNHLHPLGFNLMHHSEALFNGGQARGITGLQGPHQDSQLECIKIRSTPKIQLIRVSPLLNEGAQRNCTIQV